MANRTAAVFRQVMWSVAQADDSGVSDRELLRLGGLIPAPAFELRAMLPSEFDPKGLQSVDRFVKVGRGKVKSGETIDLGDLKIPAVAEK
jgi:hypothetical protein